MNLLADVAEGVSYLAKVIADNWPWFLSSIVAITGGVTELCRRGTIWFGTQIVLPLKNKAVTTVDEFKTKHFELVDDLKGQLQRQTEAAEQSVTVLKKISDGTYATNQRVEQIAKTQEEHMRVCSANQQRIEGPRAVGIGHV